MKPYCAAFEKALRSMIQHYGISINRHNIDNDHTGQDLPRYDGLINKTGIIDIECGPNSKLSENLIYKPTQNKYGDEVEFSKFVFYTTKIKLLVKKEIAQKLSAREVNLQDLKIGVIPDTTTEWQFKNKHDLYPNFESVRVDKTGNARGRCCYTD